MFVEAMCYDLMCAHSPDEVNLYIMDFGAEALTAFADAPHVGDVILSYETEKIDNLFKLMFGKLDSRKKLLAEYGGDLLAYNADVGNPEPNIIVIINNFAAFSEIFENKLGDVIFLTREGTKYGIYFVLTCSGVTNVRFSLLQNFKNLYCLQLNNVDDYSSVVGKTDGLFPETFKGRGLYRKDKNNLFEFQVASITDDATPYSFIREYAEHLAKKYPGKCAANVPILPEKVTLQFLAGHINKNDLSRVPVGVEKMSLGISYYNFADSVVNLVLASNQEWQSFAEALAVMLSEHYGIKTMVFAPSGRVGIRAKNEKLQVYNDSAGSVTAVRELFSTVLTRNNEYKDKIAAGEIAPNYEPVFVVVQSMSLLKTMLERYKAPDDEKKDATDDTPLNRLQLSMAKCEKAHNVHFIVAESLNSLTPFTVESWYKTHFDGNNAFWVGGGVSNQHRITVNKKPKNYNEDIDSEFGFVIANAAATLVKFVQVGVS